MRPGPSGLDRPDQSGARRAAWRSATSEQFAASDGQRGAVDWDAIFRALDDQAAPQPSGVGRPLPIKQEMDQVDSSPITSSDRHQVQESGSWAHDALGSPPFDLRPIPSRSQSYSNLWRGAQYEPTAPNLDALFLSTPLTSPTTVDPQNHPGFFFGSAFPASTSSSSSIDQTHSTPFRSLDQIEQPRSGDMLGRPRSHSTQCLPLQHVRQSSVGYTSTQNIGHTSAMPSPAPTPLSNPTSGEDSEDKRVRNTVASAKFRAKRKQQVAAVQRTITDLEIQQAGLEADVVSLRRENGLLKEMVQLKFGTRIPKE